MTPKFSLQNVLEIRHSKVEYLEIELGKLMTALRELETSLQVLFNARTGVLEQLFLEQQGEMDLFNLSMLRANITALDERIANNRIAINEKKKQVDEKRRELVTAKQDEETLVILKNKQIEIFNQQLAEKEAKQQDDIYIAQAFRQRKEEVRAHG